LREIICEANGVHDILNVLHENDFLGSRQLYRGQGKADERKLVPGLFRNVHAGKGYRDNRRIVENQIVQKFYSRAKAYGVEEPQDRLSALALVQHYGAPTRLLDWSLDPMVALFFSLTNDNEPCALYCMAPRSRILDPSRARIDWEAADESKFDLLSFKSPLLDQRMVVQKSVFTIHGCLSGDAYIPIDDRSDVVLPVVHGSGIVIGKGGANDLMRIKIPADRKAVLFSQLASMGIDKGSLFPDLSGVGGAILDDLERNRGVIE